MIGEPRGQGGGDKAAGWLVGIFIRIGRMFTIRGCYLAEQTGAWLGGVSVWVELVVEEEVAGCEARQDRCRLWGMWGVCGVMTRSGGESGWLGGLLFYCRQGKSFQAVWLIHCPGVYGMGVHLEGRCYVG